MSFPAIERIINNSYAQIFVLLACLYLLLPDHFASTDVLCRNAGWCLDSSFMLSINRAIENRLIFGREYVATYGSLGFIGTRVIAGVNRNYLLLSDVFILANLLFILRCALKKFSGAAAALFCLFVVSATASRVLYREGVVFILLLISIFWLDYAVKYLRLQGLIIPAVVTVLLFYIKINVSFVGLLFFYVYLIYYLFAEREHRLAKILFGLAVPCAIFLLSFPLDTDLPGYTRAGLSVIDGYNDAMNTGIGEYRLATVLAMASIPVFLILFAGYFKKNSLALFSYCAFSYVLFKQSFVRSDGHVLIFFALFPAFVGVLTLMLDKPSRVLKAAVAAASLICFAVGFAEYNYSNPLNKYNYLYEVFAADVDKKLESLSPAFALPANITDEIGQTSVDILPWEINLIYFNRLNYNPRPVSQSYAAYTPYLINLNREKFESNSAPEFVIVSNQSIDNRYAFFDDQPVKISLFKNYTYKDSFDLNGIGFLLFQKNAGGGAPVEFSPPVEESVKIGEDYFLKDTNKIYFIKMKAGYSLPGKVIRFFYKPFVMTMIFTLEDGSTHSHRAVLPILESGVIVNPYVENENRKDLSDFLTGGGAAAGKKIKSFRFEVDSSTAALRYVAAKSYEENIKLSISEMTINKKSQ